MNPTIDNLSYNVFDDLFVWFDDDCNRHEQYLPTQTLTGTIDGYKFEIVSSMGTVSFLYDDDSPAALRGYVEDNCHEITYPYTL